MNQKLKWKRSSAAKTIRRQTNGGRNLVWVVVRAFLGGFAATLILLMIGAAAFARFPIPGDMVRPVACTIAGVGAALSGMLLAKGIGRQRLLCGLASGVFYSLCIAGASALKGEFAFEQRAIALVCMLLLTGMLGGTLTALRPSGRRN
ncbi:MAG TPA: TIGR04086 family membrane protein [Candidatus Gemmiger faecavium]|nr:TIGR04086 family membrane protein [Candidatus Gemmiger faecavium]